MPGNAGLTRQVARRKALASIRAWLKPRQESTAAAKNFLQSRRRLQIMHLPFTGIRMNTRLRSWLHYWTAQLLSLLNLYDRAIDEFRAAIAGDPGYAAAWRCMGFLHAKRERHGAAIDAFREALRLDPLDDVTRFNLGFILHQLNRFGEAVPEFEEVVRTSPNNDRAWYGLGLCRQQLGDMARAVEALKEAARIQYFNPHAGYHLALLYHKLGENEKARAEYERVKSFEPKFAEQIRRETGIA